MHLDSHILPALGDRSVSSLKRRDCRDLVATCRAKGLARSSVRGMIRTLSTMLSQAVEDELLDANPALRMGRYLRAGDEAEHSIDPLTRAEAATLLSAARDRYPRLFPLLCAPSGADFVKVSCSACVGPTPTSQGGQNLVHGTTTTPKNHQAGRSI